MNYFQRRRFKKQIKHLLHDARHACHMREDITDPAKIDGVREAQAHLEAAWSERDYAAAESAAERLIERTEAVYPPKSNPRIREYVEILVVAISVAMAFRTFFVQPFKIPTGSMEPTLYGIKVESQVGAGLMDRFPLNLVSLALFGDRYVEIRAARSGVVQSLVRDETRTYILSPDGIIPPFRPQMAKHFEVGDYVNRGDLVASGRVKSGDHIFVNKVRYNFTRPERGDVYVFRTDDVEHPDVQEDTFYIKRLAGMPGEEIAISPPYLLVDGEPLTEPDVFARQVRDRHLGYHGYVFPPTGNAAMPVQPVLRENETLTLADNEYLPLGDNTQHSLDGRYFGGIKEQNIVGPAVAIYWPLSPRWGWIR